MAATTKTLEAIQYSRGELRLLDQRRLPLAAEYLDIQTVEEAWKAIQEMVVRGAPAIAITAALALANDLGKQGYLTEKSASASEVQGHVQKTIDYLTTSRPTAVNLMDAAKKLKALAVASTLEDGATGYSVCKTVIEACEEMLVQDVKDNRAIGAYGADFLAQKGSARRKLRLLTHCNTGSLATAGYGTALGIVRMVHERGLLEMAYCTETRPFNQGSRLTAFELVHDGVPATLIADSAAGFLMARRMVDAVIVGADRVTRNGDTANKIGTLSLATNAKKYGIPFLVAAPSTSIDLTLNTGLEIPIEERSDDELISIQVPGTNERLRSVVQGIKTWNPSFDVTPSDLISGIVTETGVSTLEDGARDLSKFLAARNEPEGSVKVSPFTTETVIDYIWSEVPMAVHILGGLKSQWTASEVGDGNINFVFIVRGPAGGICVKQALPFVRCVGESWPLTVDRIKYESSALELHGKACPAHVPFVLKVDSHRSAIVMQYLAPPHLVMRGQLVTGATFTMFSQQMSEYLARTLFESGFLNLGEDKIQLLHSEWDNSAMCELTETVIFTEPFIQASNNRHTTPYLDDDVKAIQEDSQLKEAAQTMLKKFTSSHEALIHGDLHTGSVMCDEKSMYVIDPEFAFYGPIGFDLGAIFANLFLAYFASDGLESTRGERDEQRLWLIESIASLWNLFLDKLWRYCKEANSDHAQEALKNQEKLTEKFYLDMLGFAGCKMIRRIVGIAHVADMESIHPESKRAECERRALTFGTRLLKFGALNNSELSNDSLSSIEGLVKALEQGR